MSDSDANQGIFAKFRSRYLLKLTVVGAVVLLIIAGVGVTSISSANNDIKQSTQSELTVLAGVQSQTATNWFENFQRQTRLLSNFSEIRSSSRAQRFLARQVEANGSGSDTLGDEVLFAHVVEERQPSMGGATRAPTIETSSNASLSGRNVSDVNPPWLEQMENESRSPVGNEGILDHPDEVRITRPYEVPWHDGKVIAAVTPINRTELTTADEFTFRLVVVVDASDAASQILRAPGQGGTAAVVRDGTVLLSTNEAVVGQQIGIDDGGQSRYLSDVSLSGEQQATGVAPIFVAGHEEGTEGFNASLAAMQPRSSAFALADSVQNTILILTGVVLLAFLVFFTLISRGAIADIRELSREAQLVAENYDADVQLETDRIDEIGQLVMAVDEMQRSLNEQITDRIEELEQLNSQMATAVDEQSDVMNACAEGDLSRRMDPDTGVDQLDELAASFNSMMNDIQASIQEALSFSYTVASASEQAAAAAQESKQASQLVSEATQEISQGTDRQSEELAATVQEMSSFSASIEEVASTAHQLSTRSDDAADTAHQLSTRSDDAADTADQGREAARQAVDQLNKIEDETNQVVESFEELRDEAQEIERIVDFISDVAEQTNMLALNANIEASRAGGGEGDEEGFGVVAQEIKELANDTQEAAGDIENRLTAIQERTEETSSNIYDAQASIEEGTNTIQEALQALDSIAAAVQDVNVSVQEIDDVVEDQSETAQQVVTRVEEVSDIADRNAEQAEDVAAAAEEQTVTVDEISSTVDTLSEQADQLADLLDQFTVDTTADAESIPTDDD